MKLDIGCGKTWPEGWEGIDIVDFGQKYVHNLEKVPWPIEDESCEELRAMQTLEHIHQDKVLDVMNECWRILKHDTKFHIAVPKFPSDNAVQDPTHYSFWVVKSFTYYFAGKHPGNAQYYDSLKRPMRKWAIANDGKENYLMEVDDRSIDIWLWKR